MSVWMNEWFIVSVCSNFTSHWEFSLAPVPNINFNQYVCRGGSFQIPNKDSRSVGIEVRLEDSFKQYYIYICYQWLLEDWGVSFGVENCTFSKMLKTYRYNLCFSRRIQKQGRMRSLSPCRIFRFSNKNWRSEWNCKSGYGVVSSPETSPNLATPEARVDPGDGSGSLCELEDLSAIFWSTVGCGRHGKLSFKSLWVVNWKGTSWVGVTFLSFPWHWVFPCDWVLAHRLCCEVKMLLPSLVHKAPTSCSLPSCYLLCTPLPGNCGSHMLEMAESSSG